MITTPKNTGSLLSDEELQTHISSYPEDSDEYIFSEYRESLRRIRGAASIFTLLRKRVRDMAPDEPW